MPISRILNARGINRSYASQRYRTQVELPRTLLIRNALEFSIVCTIARDKSEKPLKMNRKQVLLIYNKQDSKITSRRLAN